MKHTYDFISFEEESFSSIAIVPKQAFVDWARSNVRDDDDFTVEEVFDDDFNTYLIPEMPDRNSAMEYIEENVDFIFAHELSEWSGDQNDWPALTYENFKIFCKVIFSSMVYDCEKLA